MHESWHDSEWPPIFLIIGVYGCMGVWDAFEGRPESRIYYLKFEVLVDKLIHM